MYCKRGHPVFMYASQSLCECVCVFTYASGFKSPRVCRSTHASDPELSHSICCSKFPLTISRSFGCSRWQRRRSNAG